MSETTRRIFLLIIKKPFFTTVNRSWNFGWNYKSDLAIYTNVYLSCASQFMTNVTDKWYTFHVTPCLKIFTMDNKTVLQTVALHEVGNLLTT
jgi:hypothetical protein